jgi:DNA-binding MarR family transcriptional regulator
MELSGRNIVYISTVMNGPPAASTAAELLGALHTLEARLEAAVEPFELSLAKFGVLARLASAGESLSLRALAERCACVKSNITQLVDRLEGEGLVTREDDAQDRRSVRAVLTRRGRERHAAAARALQAVEQEVFRPLSPQQRDDLLALVRALKSCV